MKNTFKANVEATRNQIAVIEAEKVAKEIKQYGGLDVYNLMKNGQMYAIIVDGIVIGGAITKEDAEAAVEFLTHFTEGKVLNKNTLAIAMNNSITAIAKANNLIEAEADGIGITKTFTIDGKDYIIDDTNELYTVNGKHICNVADIVEAKEIGSLSDELFDEILKSRIRNNK